MSRRNPPIHSRNNRAGLRPQDIIGHRLIAKESMNPPTSFPPFTLSLPLFNLLHKVQLMNHSVPSLNSPILNCFSYSLTSESILSSSPSIGDTIQQYYHNPSLPLPQSLLPLLTDRLAPLASPNLAPPNPFIPPLDDAVSTEFDRGRSSID